MRDRRAAGHDRSARVVRRLTRRAGNSPRITGSLDAQSRQLLTDTQSIGNVALANYDDFKIGIDCDAKRSGQISGR
jgi:hypothetical protein